ncbi:MAG: hypothetical protein M3Y85_06725 [Bacteroidota bacterium]|nr:hypothetical protein [Bacteroidota bacterium]
MKKIFATIVGIFLLSTYCFAQVKMVSQVKTVASKKAMAQKKTMNWTTKSTAAHDLADKGSVHFMNAEFEQAYQDFTAALKLDPNFTVPLVFMTNLTTDETKKMYAEKALKSAANKTVGEKLFASLADPKMTAENRREIWGQLHTMFPDGGMIGNFYVATRATPEERFAAAQDYIKQFPTKPWMYNTIAYYYMLDKKDNEMAKKNLEKYLELYPEGCNPYDSMGEFYLNSGDLENSEKYYKMALQKYPFYNSSINALQKMADDKKKKNAN